MSMISLVQSHDPWRQFREYQESVKKSINVGRICWKGRYWVWSERAKEWWILSVVIMTKMAW